MKPSSCYSRWPAAVSLQSVNESMSDQRSILPTVSIFYSHAISENTRSGTSAHQMDTGCATGIVSYTSIPASEAVAGTTIRGRFIDRLPPCVLLHSTRCSTRACPHECGRWEAARRYSVMPLSMSSLTQTLSSIHVVSPMQFASSAGVSRSTEL